MKCNLLDDTRRLHAVADAPSHHIRVTAGTLKLCTSESTFDLPNQNCGNVLKYSLPSAGPAADPSVQEVTRRWLLKSSPRGRLPLLLLGLRSPSQPKNVTVLQPLLIYTAWWQRYIGVNNLPKVVMQLCPHGNWTYLSQGQRLTATPLHHQLGWILHITNGNNLKKISVIK